ncbi:MAG: CPBP family intramembrane metalloprotease [bacterium]|nr:CPBP family intramembrane metalloprotease [bacterium]
MTWRQKGYNILAVFGFDLVWSVMVLVVLSFFMGDSVSQLFQELVAATVLSGFSLAGDGFWLFFLMSCVVAPLWEEYIFRRWPLSFMETYIEDQATRRWLAHFYNNDFKEPDQATFDAESEAIRRRRILATAIAASIIFGILHGSIFNILIQGASGLVACWLYYRNDRCYWSVVISHGLWNFMVIWGLALLV